MSLEAAEQTAALASVQVAHIFNRPTCRTACFEYSTVFDLCRINSEQFLISQLISSYLPPRRGQVGSSAPYRYHPTTTKTKKQNLQKNNRPPTLLIPPIPYTTLHSPRGVRPLDLCLATPPKTTEKPQTQVASNPLHSLAPPKQQAGPPPPSKQSLDDTFRSITFRPFISSPPHFHSVSSRILSLSSSLKPNIPQIPWTVQTEGHLKIS